MNETSGWTITGVAVMALLAVLIINVRGCVTDEQKLLPEQVKLEMAKKEYMSLFMIRLNQLDDDVAKEFIKNIDAMGKFLEMDQREQAKVVEKIKEEKGGDPEWMDSFSKKE